MKNKFYEVKTKCGHVGRNNYREVTFPVNADSGKEAAKIARWMPRVKHHQKDAILGVNEIGFDDYQKLVTINKTDPYLNCKNIQEQNMYCSESYLNVKRNETILVNSKEKRMERVIYKQKRIKQMQNDVKDYFRFLSTDELASA